MPRRADINTGDLLARRHLVRHLRDTRRELGILHTDIAASMWVTFSAISRFERETSPNPRISTCQRFARALSHTITFRLEGLPAVNLGAHGDLLTRLTRSTDPEKADSAQRSLILAQIVAARHALGLRLRDVADVIGVNESQACLIESEASDPLLSSYQRHARAMGGRLAFRLRPIETVDKKRTRQIVDDYLELRDQGYNRNRIAARLHMSRNTLDQVLKRAALAGDERVDYQPRRAA